MCYQENIGVAWYCICNIELLFITVFIMFMVYINLLESKYCTPKHQVCTNYSIHDFDMYSIFLDGTLT